MKKNIWGNSYLFFSVLLLIIGEALIFSVLEKSIFSIYFNSSYLGWLVFFNVLFYLGYSVFLYIKKILVRENLYNIILPALLSIGLILFFYFSSSFWLDQIILAMSFVANIFILGRIEKKLINPFGNFISFFTSFLLFFSVYSFFYGSNLPYWLLTLGINALFVFLIYYDLASFNMNNNFLWLALIIFAILISESFLFSFFLPTDSILLKALFMTFIYYLYWSGIEAYLKEKVVFWNFLKNLATFVFLMILIGVYSYLWGDLR